MPLWYVNTLGFLFVMSAVCLFCELSLCLRLLFPLLSHDSEKYDGGPLGYCGDKGDLEVILGDNIDDDKVGEVLPDG